MTSSRPLRPDRLDDGDDTPPSNRLTFADWVALALRAARRRSWAVVLVFLLGAGATTSYYRWLEPTYRVEAKILAQRSQALPSAVRAVYEDVPTRSAWEMMHRRDGLIAIIRQARLLPEDVVPEGGEGEAPAPPAASGGADDPLEKLLKVLDERLRVTTEEGIISVSLEWPDPQQAYEIVQGVVSNFLEARHLQEVTAIDEVIAVLRARAAQLGREVDEALADARSRTAAAPRPVLRVRHPSAELLRLQSMLDAKERAIQDVEEFRRRRLADLQAQLDQARNTMSDAHPTVISLRKDIDALARESPQIQGLREEERTLRRQYTQGLAREGIRTLGPPATSPQVMGPVATPEEDPQVRQVRLQYEQILSRINSAQVELDAARAAFKYRYNVVWPPRLPTEPVSPDPRKFLLVGGLASILLALAAAAAPDLARGRVVERWQVEKSLGLEVIGEVRRQG